MRDDRDNIFLNVVTLENQTTELLRNFLQFKLFRDIFLSLFLSDNEIVNSVENEHVITQKYLQDYGTPDLCIENDSLLVLCEVKINDTSLTENQPEGYLNFLLSTEQNIDKWLVFIVPRDYRNYQEIEKKYEMFRIRNPNQTINTKIITWQEIIRIIEAKKLHACSCFICEFYEFIKSRFESKILEFSKEEVLMLFNKQMPKMLLNLFEIVDGVKNKITTYSASTATGKQEYGLYFKNNNGDRILFFGIWYDFWKEYEKPLCYGVDLKNFDNAIIKRFSNLIRNQYQDYDNWRIAWITEEVFYDKDNIVVIAKHIEDILSKLTGSS